MSSAWRRVMAVKRPPWSGPRREPVGVAAGLARGRLPPPTAVGRRADQAPTTRAPRGETMWITDQWPRHRLPPPASRSPTRDRLPLPGGPANHQGLAARAADLMKLDRRPGHLTGRPS